MLESCKDPRGLMQCLRGAESRPVPNLRSGLQPCRGTGLQRSSKRFEITVPFFLGMAATHVELSRAAQQVLQQERRALLRLL